VSPEEEFLAVHAELARRGAGYGDAVDFARQLGMEPDPWQERVLCWTGKRLLLNCARQAGKSTTTSVLALHRALTQAGALVLLISPSLRQSAELFRKVIDAISLLPARPDMTEENKLSVRFANGSRIVSLPSSEATIRGFSRVSLIIEDEAAFVDDDLNTALRPMLAVSDGQLILMSTPNGRRGHFFEAWEREGSAWERVQVTAFEVPRISRSFLEGERRVMGERFRQEYQCEFINAATGRVYDGFDEKRNVLSPLPKAQYFIVGLDFGIVDQNGVSVVGWRDHDTTVYVEEGYRIAKGVTEMAEEVKRIEAKYKPVRIVGDVGGQGKAFEHEMRTRHGLPIEAADKHNKVGYITLANDALRTGRVRVSPSCRDLIDEWLTLPWADSLADRRENRQREADGYDNHAADAFLYAWRACVAYHELPENKPPAKGTREALEAEEKRIFDKRIEEADRRRSREWWEQ